MSARHWRLAWPWLLVLLAAAAAAWLRYGLIESSAIGQQCASGQAAPWWCDVRQWLVLGFLNHVYGVTALVIAMIALFSKRLWLAWLAAALGAFALQLYCVETGALAWLIGSLRLLRLQANLLTDARGTPVEPHRQGEQQVQAQP